jgi:hypothetical protein
MAQLVVWAVDCALKDASAFIKVEDLYTDPLSAITFSLFVRPAATPTVPIRVTNMRLNPVVPDWFAENNWSQLAFTAIAPSAAPTIPTPNLCGTSTTITVGATSGIAVVALVAGTALSGQTRPSSAISDYLESRISNCNFSASNTLQSATYNDTVLPLAP